MKTAGKIDRLTTGIPGMDELIDGGTPRGSTCLLAGGAGTGKTIMATHVVANTLKNDEKVLFLSLERSGEDIIKQAAAFGWDLNKGIENKFQLTINTPMKSTIDLTALAGEITSFAMRQGCSLVVIDSISKLMDLGTFPVKTKGEKEVTTDGRDIKRQDMVRFLLELKKKLKGTGVTLILIGEANEEGKTITKNGIAEFECDGVILLHYLTVGARKNRTLSIRKMRDTQHSDSIHPVEIVSGKGIIVKEAEDAYKV